MKKNHMSFYLFLFILFIIISSCSRKDTQLSPEGVPTLTPTNTPTGPMPTPVSTINILLDNGVITLNLPASVNGKNYYVYIFDTFTGFLDADASISGVCGSSPSTPYSLNLPNGNYYLVAYVDNDNNASPDAGDYVGVYGTTWPSWPAGANLSISGGENINCTITLVTGFNNVSGIINLYEPAPNEVCKIFIDTDTNQTNSNHVAYKTVFIMEGVMSAGYSLLVMVPGNYYVYAGVDIDESGLPFTTPDQFGYYGVCGCSFPNPPGYANASIMNLNNPYNFSFNIFKYQ